MAAGTAKFLLPEAQSLGLLLLSGGISNHAVSCVRAEDEADIQYLRMTVKHVMPASMEVFESKSKSQVNSVPVMHGVF